VSQQIRQPQSEEEEEDEKKNQKKQIFVNSRFLRFFCSLSQIVTHLISSSREEEEAEEDEEERKKNGRTTKPASLKPRVNTTRDTKRRGLEEALSNIYASGKITKIYIKGKAAQKGRAQKKRDTTRPDDDGRTRTRKDVVLFVLQT